MGRSLLCLLFVVACSSQGASTQYSSSAPSSQPKSAPVSLWFAGDVHLGQSSTNLLEGLLPAVRDAGCGVVNLEGAISTNESKIIDGKPNLFNHPRALSQLISLGVCVIGVANNHSRDAGEDGPSQTIKAIQDAHLQPTGDAAGFALITLSGHKIAITAHDLTAGVPSTIKKDLETARANAERLIATFHVTGPPSYLPSKELREAVAIALAAGAQVVVAHGSHMLGPVERRGDAVIAWGLGNVAFSCDCTDEEEALLLRVRWSNDSLFAEVVPIFAGLKGAPARLVPEEKRGGLFDLLESLGSSPITRTNRSASF